MVTQFEYGGYAVVARAIRHAAGGFAGVVTIADAFGEPAPRLKPRQARPKRQRRHSPWPRPKPCAPSTPVK